MIDLYTGKIIRQPYFRCPKCGRLTYHPEDIKHKYCPCCGGPGYPTGCEHVSTAEYLTELLDQ